MIPSSANTTSGDSVSASYKQRIEGDCIPDQVFDELCRRLVLSVDTPAREAEGVSNVGVKQTTGGTLAVGATDITFTWDTAFQNTTYSVSFAITDDPGAPYRWWVETKQVNKITIKVVGHTKPVGYNLILEP